MCKFDRYVGRCGKVSAKIITRECSFLRVNLGIRREIYGREEYRCNVDDGGREIWSSFGHGTLCKECKKYTWPASHKTTRQKKGASGRNGGGVQGAGVAKKTKK